MIEKIRNWGEKETLFSDGWGFCLNFRGAKALSDCKALVASGRL